MLKRVQHDGRVLGLSWRAVPMLVGLLAPSLALAQTPDPALLDAADSGDTAWLLTSAAFVLLMAAPGLTLFYGGLVRAKGFLAVLVQVGAVVAVSSLLWVAVGYSLAFGTVTGGWLGGGNALMLGNLGNVREGLTVPESGFAVFQLTFAVITPALMVGRLGRSCAVRLGAGVLRAVGADRLCPGCALDLGRRLAGDAVRHARFRRRDRRPRHCRGLGAGRRAAAGQARRAFPRS